VGEKAFAQALPYLQRALAGEQTGYEAWMDYDDLGRRYMRVSYMPRRGFDGRVEGVYAQVIDDTESRLAEEAKREQDERLKRTQESLSLAMKAGRMGWWSRDLISGEVRWSPELEAIFGLHSGTFHGDEVRFLEFVLPEDRELIVNAVREAIETRQDYAVDFRFLRVDGTQGWMEGRGRAVYGPEGPTSIFGIGIDVTARREFEERLQESEARLDLALAAASLGTWDLNLVTGETKYGGAAAALFGRPAGDFSLAYPEWRALIDPQDARRLNAGFAAMIESDEPFRMEFRSPMPDGSVRWLEVSGITVRDGDGKATRAMGVFSDVTARRAYEDELERRVRERTVQLEAARRSQESWNYSVSHDLRAPLRAVMSTSRILQMDHAEELSKEARELLSRQVSAAKKLGNLIDELLETSRLASQDLLLEPLDISAIAREAAEEQAAHSEKRFDLSVADGMRGMGDPRLVKLVFTNFIENAMKYSPSDTFIEVGQQDEAFFVRDQGIGFDMEYEAKVWRPFERLVLDAEYAGTGIGLYNVAQMVERMGGRAWAESEPGKGSTFYFTLGR
jgi:PAS domain S-box-containing protein